MIDETVKTIRNSKVTAAQVNKILLLFFFSQLFDSITSELSLTSHKFYVNDVMMYTILILTRKTSQRNDTFCLQLSTLLSLSVSCQFSGSILTGKL